MYTVRSGAALMGWIYNGVEFIKANRAQRRAYDDFKRHELAITALGEPYTVPVIGVLAALGTGALSLRLAALIAPTLNELIALLSPEAAAAVEGLSPWQQWLILANPLAVGAIVGIKGEQIGLEIREKILSLNLGNRLFSVFR